MAAVVSFPSASDPRLDEVGGKGLSLLRLARAGFPVPPGVILPTPFFAKWLRQLHETDAWREFLKASDGGVKAACERLQAECRRLSVDEEQAREVDEALAKLGVPFVAVRSSAPEEDLEGASFAGGYVTVLGVSAGDWQDAVRSAFCSCLDYRVYVYKRGRGYNPRDPKIAVILQAQIASDAAGVGFSINPLNNDFDEAVINSNWGLGETVVSGRVTPDTFIAHKPTGEIIETRTGAKEFSLRLGEDGRPVEFHGPPNGLSLGLEEVALVRELIGNVEDHYGKPMDIEWCFSRGKLHLLQARPITAFVPVPPELATASGAPRRLYWDGTLSGQGIAKPMSVLGTDVMRILATKALRDIYGKAVRDFYVKNMVVMKHGRFYAKASRFLGVFGKKKFATLLKQVDTATAKAIDTLDIEKYVTPEDKFPRQLMAQIAWRIFRLLPRLIPIFLWPRQAHEASGRVLAGVRQKLRDGSYLEAISADEPLDRFVDRQYDAMAGLVPRYSLTRFAAAKLAEAGLYWIFPDEVAAPLTRGLPHNVTVEMGLAVAEVARRFSPEVTPDEVLDRLAGKAPEDEEARTLWESLLVTYGHRGPVEIDAGSPRYRDDPRMLVSLVTALAKDPEEPGRRARRAAAAREEAYEKLLGSTRGWRKHALKLLYRVVVQLGGYRELHKYYMSLGLWLIQKRALVEGKELHAAGRLDRPEQAFDLTVAQLAAAAADQNLDARELAAANRVWPDKLAAAPHLPQLFDSRGRIIRPPAAAAREGEVAGSGISTGVARGPACVMKQPDEKPFGAGDVLVARATDPGWTPLFASASAVVLEVGGALQHGALVAREYGLPCVAGIPNATTVFKDGMVLEVDGGDGVVRILEEEQAIDWRKRARGRNS